MARIRTIKPEFFTSPDICGLSPLARLLYIALWCESDREGRLAWNPRAFKIRYLPEDQCNAVDIGAEIITAGLVVPYDDEDGNSFAVIPSFKKHQQINVKEAQSRLPEPPPHVKSHDFISLKIPKEVRDTVMARDSSTCTRCSAKNDITLDHIFPVSIGGTHVVTNLRVLCRACNSARPVAGQALIEDLKRDGLSMKDMERTCLAVKAREVPAKSTGKGKERKGSLTTIDESFSVPDDWIAEATEKQPGIDWRREAIRFASHHVAKGSTFRDWKAAWRTWINSPYEKSKPSARAADDGLPDFMRGAL